MNRSLHFHRLVLMAKPKQPDAFGMFPPSSVDWPSQTYQALIERTVLSAVEHEIYGLEDCMILFKMSRDNIYMYMF